MDKVDFVTRRYKQILPKPIGFVQDSQLRRLDVWLRDDLCPVVEDFARRPIFREKAAWVLDSIRPGVLTPERQAIEALDASIVVCARALAELGSKSRVHAKLVALYPAQTRVVEEAVELREGRQRVLSRKPGSVDVLAIELSQVTALAKGPWDDLVNVNDYFEPQPRYAKTADGQRLQWGEFIVSLNPELHPVGNFVVRCMFRRVDVITATLSAVRGKMMHALRTLGRRYAGEDQLDAAWKSFQASLAEVKKTFQTGAENQLRDSCMILTQIYAAFDPSPSLDWLDVSPEAIERGVGSLRHRITHFQNGEMFERIAAAVGDLRRLYVDELPEQRAIDEAIATGGLVIDKQLLKVYWQGKLVPGNWKRSFAAWKLLVALTEKAGRRSFVSESDLYGDDVVGVSTMANNANRLKGLLPVSLRKHIVLGPDPRTYRLDLPRDQNYLFESAAAFGTQLSARRGPVS